MKRNALSFILAAVMLFCALPLTAYAANETEATTTVSYTKAAPADDAPAVSYEVNIPASISLNDSQYLYISASNVSIGDSQTLTVTIDGSRTYNSNGDFILTNANTTDSIACYINRIGSAGGELINGQAAAVVATFINRATAPESFGSMRINPAVNANLSPGTYTGTIYFTIAVTGS